MAHHHHDFLSLLKNRELNELYLSIAIKSFALSIIGVFIPIYLIKEGFSLGLVLIFFAIYAGTHAFSVFPAAKLALRFGFKHIILFSIPFLILGLVGLFAIDFAAWVFYASAILLGINNAFFWIGYHVDFATVSDRKKRGTEVGITRVAALLVHSVGPILGGFVLAFVGFNILFIVSVGLLFLSAFPLFLSKELHKPSKVSFRGVFKLFKFRNFLSFAGFGFERVVSSVVWPIFIFFFILGEKYTLLGGVASLALISASFFVFVIGRYTDSNRKLVMKLGAIGNAIVWFAKSFVVTPVQVFIADLFYGASQTSVGVPFDVLCYDKANKGDVVKFVLFREFSINICRAFLFVVFVFIADTTAKLLVGGSVGSLLMILF